MPKKKLMPAVVMAKTSKGSNRPGVHGAKKGKPIKPPKGY